MLNFGRDQTRKLEAMGGSARRAGVPILALPTGQGLMMKPVTGSRP